MLLSQADLLGKSSLKAAVEEQQDAFLTFACYMAYTAWNARGRLTERLKETDMLKLYEEIELPLVYTLSSMEREGIAADRQEYDWYGARYLYEDSTYYKGTAEEINAYLDEKLEDKTFSFYYARKFADFAGLYMVFFATIMLAVF